jgi:hypothetical protein
VQLPSLDFPPCQLEHAYPQVHVISAQSRIEHFGLIDSYTRPPLGGWSQGKKQSIDAIFATRTVSESGSISTGQYQRDFSNLLSMRHFQTELTWLAHSA